MSNNAKDLWKHQPEEPSNMTLEELRRRARSLKERTRQDTIQNIAMTAILLLLSAFGLGRSNDLIQQVLYGTAAGWAVLALLFLNRGAWEAEPGQATGADLYRFEIERRRRLLRRLSQWSFGPLVFLTAAFSTPAANAVIREPALVFRAAPFGVLLVAWVIAYFYQRRQGMRELQRELDSLTRLENQR